MPGSNLSHTEGFIAPFSHTVVQAVPTQSAGIFTVVHAMGFVSPIGQVLEELFAPIVYVPVLPVPVPLAVIITSVPMPLPVIVCPTASVPEVTDETVMVVPDIDPFTTAA